MQGSGLDYLPTVWGQGQTFAFSGLDGQTDWYNPFVAQTLGEPPGILFHAGTADSRDVQLTFAGRVEGLLRNVRTRDVDARVIGPDVMDLSLHLGGSSGAQFRLAWLDRAILLGEAQGENSQPCLITDGPVDPAPGFDGESPFLIAGGVIEERCSAKVVDLGEAGRFAVAYGVDPERVAELVEVADLDSVFAERLRFYRDLSLPDSGDGELLRTYVKACAVMKVNVETECGEIRRRWTTPDRWPHRHMWLWDSAFHALGAQHLSPELGRDCIRAVLTKQRQDGFIPHTMAPDPRYDSSMTQPPLLAWAALQLYWTDPQKSFLKEVYEGLKRYLVWDLSNMDRLGTGLLQWQFKGPDSGMDNSPRFDEGPDFDAVDLNCFVINECQALSRIARELGLGEEARHWGELGAGLALRVNQRLWNDDDGFYYDRRKDGSWVLVKTVDHFLPLFAGIATSRRVAVLVADHLMNPKEFWPVFPVPSVALSEKVFELDMWRGPTWINYNYLIIHGLRRSGYDDIADELLDKTVREICRWRATKGSLYEFYDPLGETAPQDLARKGRVRNWRGDGIPVISDYFWSSALLVDMVRRRGVSSTPP